MDNVSGVLIRFKDQFLTFTNVPGIKIGVIDIIEILIISVLFYHILLWIKTTRAWNLFKGLIIILLFVLVAALFQMDTILWLAEKLFNIGLVALVVIFQPELRNALENIGGKTFLGDFFNTGRGELIAHWRINIGVTPGHTVTRRSRQLSYTSHEGSADT